MHYSLLKKVLRIKTEKELRKFIWKEEFKANFLNWIIIGIFGLACFSVIPRSVFLNILEIIPFIILFILMMSMVYMLLSMQKSNYQRGVKDLKRNLKEKGFLETKKEIREFATGLNRFLVDSSKLDMREG